VKIGDLVQVSDCGNEKTRDLDWDCNCFFCKGNSNRIGCVLDVATRNGWVVMFDIGDCRLDAFDEANGRVRVINESR